MCGYTMTKLINTPAFAQRTDLPTGFVSNLVGTGQIPFVPVGRRRIDVRWVDQWLAGGGYRPYGDQSTQGDEL